MKPKQAFEKLFVSSLILSLTIVLGGCSGGGGGGSGGSGHSSGGGPDFVISSVIITPPNPEPGKPFTTSVVVQNLGNGTGNPSNLTVWLDQPNVQNCGAVGDHSSTNWQTIGTGETTGHTFDMVAPKNSPPWTFRAFVNSDCAATEVDTSNNQYSRSYGRPESKPDFAISSIVLSPSNPLTGQTFTATVTVTNLGGASGLLGYLDVWVNQPTNQSCHSMGNRYDSLGLLGTGAGLSRTYANLTAPSSAIPWTFLAFVDSECETPEINEDNNQAMQVYPYGESTLATNDLSSIYWRTPAYADYYRLTAASNSTAINMTGSFDTYLALYDSYWNYLTSDDDSGFGLNSRITYPLVAGQTYYVEATSYMQWATGTYTLTTSSGILTPGAIPFTFPTNATTSASGQLTATNETSVTPGYVGVPADYYRFVQSVTSNVAIAIASPDVYAVVNTFDTVGNRLPYSAESYYYDYSYWRRQIYYTLFPTTAGQTNYIEVTKDPFFFGQYGGHYTLYLPDGGGTLTKVLRPW